MLTYVLVFLIGGVAGLRSLTAPAIVSWAARLGWLHLERTPLAFLGYAATSYIITVLAIAELIADKLPKIPSRKAPGPFLFRMITGGLSGAALGAATYGEIGSYLSSSHTRQTYFGLIAGVLGAITGTLLGYEFRGRLVNAIGGKDFPIALLEDFIAIGGAFWICALI